MLSRSMRGTGNRFYCPWPSWWAWWAATRQNLNNQCRSQTVKTKHSRRTLKRLKENPDARKSNPLFFLPAMLISGWHKRRAQQDDSDKANNFKKRASVQPSRCRSAGTSECKSTLSKRILLESVHVLSSQAAPRIPFFFFPFLLFFLLSFFLPSSPPCFLSFILLYVLFSIVFSFLFVFLFFSFLVFSFLVFSFLFFSCLVFSFLFFSFFLSLSFLFLSFLFFSCVFFSFLLFSFLFFSSLLFSFLFFSFLVFSFLVLSFLFFSFRFVSFRFVSFLFFSFLFFSSSCFSCFSCFYLFSCLFFPFLFSLPSFLHPGVEGNLRKQLHHMTDLQPSHSLWHSMWGSYQQDKPSQQDAASISPNYKHLCSDHLWSMPIIHGHWSPNI